MKLLYFALVRQKIGIRREELSLAEGVTTVAALLEALRKRGSGYAEAFRDTSRLRCAINQEHAGFDAKVRPDDEIAFFPPVTGG